MSQRLLEAQMAQHFLVGLDVRGQRLELLEEVVVVRVLHSRVVESQLQLVAHDNKPLKQLHPVVARKLEHTLHY